MRQFTSDNWTSRIPRITPAGAQCSRRVLTRGRLVAPAPTLLPERRPVNGFDGWDRAQPDTDRRSTPAPPVNDRPGCGAVPVPNRKRLTR